MSQRLPVIILVIILIFGGYVRYWFSEGVPMWHDEAFSAHLSYLPWMELLKQSALDVHPPLYYLVLKLWQIPFGTSVDALRSLSVIFGVGSIWAGYLVAKIAFHHTPLALSAALLLAVNPFQVAYAGEARMYTMGVFLALMGLYFLLRVLGSARHHESILSNTLSYFGLVFFMSAAIYTHYYLLFTVTLFLLAGLVFKISHLRFRLHVYLPYLTGATLVGLSYVPWIPSFLYQITEVQSGFWIRNIHWMSIPGSFWNMLLGIPMSVQNLGSESLLPYASIHTYVGQSLLENWHGTEVLLGFILLLSLFLIFFAFRRGGTAGKLLALGTMAPFMGGLGYALYAHLTGSTTSIYFDRYFIFASGIFMVLIAWVCFSVRYRFLTYVLLFLYAGSALYGLSIYREVLHPSASPGMRAAIEHVAKHPHVPVVIASPLQYANAMYYAKELSPELLDRIHIWVPNSQQRIKIPHTYATTIIPNTHVLNTWNGLSVSSTTIIIWSDGFGAPEPEVPTPWNRINRKIVLDVRPPQTRLYVDTYETPMK
jgi:mannosyltransferase